jgi:hypothetical protein
VIAINKIQIMSGIPYHTIWATGAKATLRILPMVSCRTRVPTWMAPSPSLSSLQVMARIRTRRPSKKFAAFSCSMQSNADYKELVRSERQSGTYRCKIAAKILSGGLVSDIVDRELSVCQPLTNGTESPLLDRMPPKLADFSLTVWLPSRSRADPPLDRSTKAK